VIASNVGKCGLFNRIFATSADRRPLLGIQVDLYQALDVVFSRRGDHIDVHEAAPCGSPKGKTFGWPQQA
jgi:hypothetical protein